MDASFSFIGFFPFLYPATLLALHRCPLGNDMCKMFWQAQGCMRYKRKTEMWTGRTGVVLTDPILSRYFSDQLSLLMSSASYTCLAELKGLKWKHRWAWFECQPCRVQCSLVEKMPYWELGGLSSNPSLASDSKLLSGLEHRTSMLHSL